MLNFIEVALASIFIVSSLCYFDSSISLTVPMSDTWSPGPVIYFMSDPLPKMWLL